MQREGSYINNDKERLDYYFVISAEYDDFVEFLTDIYMEPGEFKECFDQFKTWRESQ